MKTVDGGSTGTFVYNAVGQRVQKNIGGTSYYYLHDGFGNVAVVRSSSSLLEKIIPDANAKYYQNGAGWKTDYLHGNPLGTTQIVTQADTSVEEERIFYPFGILRWQSGGSQDARFASMQERDSETVSWQNSLDWTPNRTFGENMGRWFSPDPLAGDITDPQSFNRYAYVMNNPTTLADPLGLHPQPCTNTNCAWQYYAGSVNFLFNFGGPGGWDQFLIQDIQNNQDVGFDVMLGVPKPGADNLGVLLAFEAIPVGALSYFGGLGDSGENSNIVYVGDLLQNQNVCVGKASVIYTGNPDMIGEGSGYGPNGGNPITPDTAAVIPDQWGQKTLSPYAFEISGDFIPIGQWFDASDPRSFTNVAPMGGKRSRAKLLRRYPNKLILEMYSGKQSFPNAVVVLFQPASLPCPRVLKKVS